MNGMRYTETNKCVSSNALPYTRMPYPIDNPIDNVTHTTQNASLSVKFTL